MIPDYDVSSRYRRFKEMSRTHSYVQLIWLLFRRKKPRHIEVDDNFHISDDEMAPDKKTTSWSLRLFQQYLSKYTSRFTVWCPDNILSKIYHAIISTIIILMIFGFISLIISLKPTSRYRPSNSVEELLCRSDEQDINIHKNTCYTKQELNNGLLLLRDLFNILSRYANHFYCESTTESPQMTVNEAHEALKIHRGSYIPPDQWTMILRLITKYGHQWHLVAYTQDGLLLNSTRDPDIVTSLECMRPYIPIRCRLVRISLSVLLTLRSALTWVMNCVCVLFCLLFMVLLVTAIGMISLSFKHYRQRRKTKREQECTLIVADIIKMLHQQRMINERDSAIPNCISVTTIRQVVAQYNPKVIDSGFWSDVKQCIYNEPSIGMQERRELGEVWFSYPSMMSPRPSGNQLIALSPSSRTKYRHPIRHMSSAGRVACFMESIPKGTLRRTSGHLPLIDWRPYTPSISTNYQSSSTESLSRFQKPSYSYDRRCKFG